MSLLLALLLFQEGRAVPFNGQAVEVRVPVSSDAQHRATVVTFPEPSLESMVAGWSEGDLSIERRRENLFIKLLRRAEGDVHVLGSSGTLYRLRIRPAEGAYDGWVRIEAPPSAKAIPSPEPIELLRAMRLGRKPADGAVLKASGEVYRSAEISVRLAYVYETPVFRGYVARVENISGAPRRLDPSRFLARGLILVGARGMVLEPGEGTLLYFVFGKRP